MVRMTQQSNTHTHVDDVGLTQRLDDGVDSVDDAVGGHQVGLSHRHFIDIHSVVPLKDR